jgi:hypothetical protein
MMGMSELWGGGVQTDITKFPPYINQQTNKQFSPANAGSLFHLPMLVISKHLSQLTMYWKLEAWKLS